MSFARSDAHRSAFALALATVALSGVGASSASAASLTRSVVVRGTPSSVWSMIGPYCAIKNWLPPVGSCTEDGEQPPTRTLVTKDGTATFVERQTARNDAEHFYTYTFVNRPLPVNHYKSTISVTANGVGYSTVTWRGSYIPDAGKEKAARQALEGIYAAGLDSIKAQATQQLARVAASGAGQ